LLAEKRTDNSKALHTPIDDDSYTYDEGTIIQYMYGVNGISGFTVTENGKTNSYYYCKNLQGDVTHIADLMSNVYAAYKYDAWGNHKVYDMYGNEVTDPEFIGNINPIRYRGYYFDTETNLYYLQSRYYDAEVGRFISPDDLNNMQLDTINGLNLYAYCLNNPIMYIDPTGKFFWLIPILIIGIVAAATVVAGTIKGIDVAMKGGNFWDGFTGFYDNLWDKTKNFFVNDVYHGFIEPIFVTGKAWENAINAVWNGIDWLNKHFGATLTILSLVGALATLGLPFLAPFTLPLMLIGGIASVISALGYIT